MLHVVNYTNVMDTSNISVCAEYTSVKCIYTLLLLLLIIRKNSFKFIYGEKNLM